MKFKNDKTQGEPACNLILTDKCGDVLDITIFAETRKDAYDVSVVINEEPFGLSRSKALKLAWAIIGELDPVEFKHQ